MFPSREPFEADFLVHAAITTQVPEIVYASPLTDASEAVRTPGVVWDDFSADNSFSYQDLLATKYLLSIHVSGGTRREAKDMAKKVWLALMQAPSLDLSQVDSTQQILAVFDRGAPVENRTQGQALNFYEFRFSIDVLVGRNYHSQP